MQHPPGVIFFTDALEAKALEAFALRLEELGYHALWVPEFVGREPFATASFVLAKTTRLEVATGIANVYARDAIVTAQARQALAELSGGRFILGLGVSHPQMAEAHGLEWVPPVRKMRNYLDTLEKTVVQAPEPATPAPIWISAHAPGLLKLAAARADAANTYLMPPAHTAKSRELVGPDLRINVVVPCCLCDDPGQARKIARKALSIYLSLPAYQRQWLQWGFTESDFQEGGSDHLVDSLVAWGDVEAIRARMDEHVAAGANQIEVSALHPEGGRPRPHWALLEALAP